MSANRRLLNLTLEKFANKSFTKCLAANTARLIQAEKDGVTFEYAVPASLCRASSHSSAPKLSTGAALALFDEFSTFCFMLKDNRCRSGVSIHLTTDMLGSVPADSTIRIVSRCTKVGKTIGFCDMEMLDASNSPVARGKHIKYLHQGAAWNLFAHPRVLPVMLDMLERFGDKIFWKFGMKLFFGGANRTVTTEVSSSTLCSVANSLGIEQISPQHYKLHAKPHMNNISGILHGGAVAIAAEEASIRCNGN